MLALSEQANANWQNSVGFFYGSSGGSCGGTVGVGNNLYNYPETIINTPGNGLAQCYATQASIDWGADQLTVGPLQGASTVVYGPQGSAANWGGALGCPGIYNCSGWQKYYP